MSVRVKGDGTSDLRGPATKETVTGSTAARKGSSAIQLSFRAQLAAAAALSAAQAGGTGQGTEKGWRSGTRCRSCWAFAKRAARLAAPRDCGDSPYSELGLRFSGPS